MQSTDCIPLLNYKFISYQFIACYTELITIERCYEYVANVFSPN